MKKGEKVLKRIGRTLKWIGIVAGAVIAILLISNAIWVWTTSSRLERKLTAIREAGDPMSLADLAGDPIPPEENAAVFLRRAQGDLEAISKELIEVYGSEGYPNGCLGESELKTIQAALEAYPDVIPLLEQAAACEQYDPQLDYTVAPDTFLEAYLDHIGDMRTVARVLWVRVLQLLSNGQRKEAMETCVEMFRLSRHFGHEPMIVGYLVSLACRGIAVEATNLVLRAGSVSKEAREMLEAELALHDGFQGYQRALKTERAYGLNSFRTNPLRNFWLVTRPLWDDAACYYIDTLDRHLAAASRPYPEVGAAAPATAPSRIGFRVLAQMVEQAIVAGRQAMERTRARIRCLRVLNAVQGHVERTGVASPKLSDLGLPKEVTSDPFSGKPLHMKKLPEGWLIYSVGKNLEDEGGDLEDSRDVGVGPIPRQGNGGT